jgi:hypothetical protein
VDRHYGLVANQFIQFTEGETYNQAIYTNEEPYICAPGDSIQLYALSAQSYLWQNNSYLNSIMVYEPAIYSVIVTNEFGLMDTAYFEVLAHTPPQIEIISQNPTCINQTDGSLIAISNQELDSNLVYSWMNNEGDALSTNSILNSIPQGEYSLVCTSPNGCLDLYAATIHDPDSIYFEYQISEPLCPYDLAQIEYVAFSNSPIMSYQTNIENTDAIAEGDYFITATDASNCTNTLNFFVDIPDSIAIINNTPLACYGQSVDAAISIENTNDYSIDWGSANPNNLFAGSYPIIVSYNQVCANTVVIAVEQLDSIVISATHYFDDETDLGNIHLDITGGAPPYQFFWSNGNTSNPLENVTSGYYNCLITDAQNCWAYSINIGLFNTINQQGLPTLSVYPNPFINEITIENAPLNQILNITDMQGRIVITQMIASQTTIVSTNQLASGIYTASIGGAYKFIVKL